MAFCPFFSTDCPENTDCAIWTNFGCCIIDKPGIPAVYTDGGTPIDVFILSMHSEKASPNDNILVVYARNSDGVIGKSDDLSKFNIHRLH